MRDKRPYAREGFPAPVTLSSGRTLLWDEEQVEAFVAGAPVPAIEGPESGEDLLDRHEAAAEVGVKATSWSNYTGDPALADYRVVVEGVEHWPRSAVCAFRDGRPGRGVRHGSGRPKGSGDFVPRDEILPRTAELLDADPAVTSQTVVAELGVAVTTAMSALATLRGRRIADVLEQEPALGIEEAAARLGYPPAVRRRAFAAAKLELCIRATRPYVEDVGAALAAAGLAEVGVKADVVAAPGGEALAAAIRLREGLGVPAVVWDERSGWRTAVSRRHPIGKDAGPRPEAPGIAYLGSGRPEPAAVIIALREVLATS
ncbi:hypothetical protein [Streptomyces sp. NPDC057686]|uniref:hypothetical protein n=1 Tax=Streptomyces sp. NPDC057686 TaxID=3346212 RepID=UPI003695D7BA